MRAGAVSPALALLSSAALHAIAWTAAGHHGVAVHDPSSEEPIAVLVEPAPADPVKPDPPEAPSDPVARSPGVRNANHAAVPRSQPAAAPPVAAAPASSAMTADTGAPLVVGSASAYAGGPTTIAGGGDGAGGGLSLPARLGGAVEWPCRWPERFDEGLQGLHDGGIVAHVAVEVDVDGSAVRVRLVSDPGYGFGTTARDCALKGRYIPGRGPDGQLARAWTGSFRVIFDPPTVIAAPEKASWETSTAQ